MPTTSAMIPMVRMLSLHSSGIDGDFVEMPYLFWILCGLLAGCISQWPMFCDKKVSEWASQCEDELIMRLKCERHQELDLCALHRNHSSSNILSASRLTVLCITPLTLSTERLLNNRSWCLRFCTANAALCLERTGTSTGWCGLASYHRRSDR